ncbi:TolC family protein [Sporomusa aerivorans]|uniref:TolC family protein n=1 Tax=Sporomusa aerivorans TaxID=204936 RepID=UPI00352AA594
MAKKEMFVGLVLAVLMVSAPVFAADAVSLTLEESTNLALKNNNQIKASASGVEVAKWNLEKSKGEKNISIDLAHTTSKIGGEYWRVFYIDQSPSNYFINSVSASLPLYSGGRIENTIKQAELSSRMSELQLQNTKQEIKYEVTQSYYNILACQNFQQVKEESVSQLAEHLKNVKAQYDVGNVTKADILRSEVELANATQGLVTAKNNTQLAMSIFNKIVGLPIQQTVTIKDFLGYEQHNYNLGDCISYALQHRPDFIASQKAVEQAEAGVKVAAADKKLNVSMDALYSTYDTKLDEFGTTQWMVGVTARLNLFDGNVTRAGIKASKGVLAQSQYNERDMEAAVELSVQEAYLNLTKAESNTATNKVAVEKATEDFALAQARYSVNLGTNLDVVDAQVALTAAKNSYIQSLYDYNVSKAALDKAMGKI